MSKLYVAYGSNLSTAQMAHRCPSATIYGTGRLIGWEMIFRGSQTGSYASIQRNPHVDLPVLVWEITERDERSLDRYEGFPRFYFKQNVMVQMDGAGKKKCMVYIMDTKRQPGIPSNAYVDVIYKGYKKFGFDTRILENALRKMKQECSELEGVRRYWMF